MHMQHPLLTGTLCLPASLCGEHPSFLQCYIIYQTPPPWRFRALWASTDPVNRCVCFSSAQKTSAMWRPWAWFGLVISLNTPAKAQPEQLPSQTPKNLASFLGVEQSLWGQLSWQLINDSVDLSSSPRSCKRKEKDNLWPGSWLSQ